MKAEKKKDCPFCKKIEEGVPFTRNRLAAALFDGYPISPGHILVVPLRHEADFFRLTDAEQRAILGLLKKAAPSASVLMALSGAQVDGFNVGINVGEAAGQTVGHAHVHLIPRYKGDVEDPRGGVRWIIPSKAKYWR